MDQWAIRFAALLQRNAPSDDPVPKNYVAWVPGKPDVVVPLRDSDGQLPVGHALRNEMAQYTLSRLERVGVLRAALQSRDTLPLAERDQFEAAILKMLGDRKIVPKASHKEPAELLKLSTELKLLQGELAKWLVRDDSSLPGGYLLLQRWERAQQRELYTMLMPQQALYQERAQSIIWDLFSVTLPEACRQHVVAAYALVEQADIEPKLLALEQKNLAALLSKIRERFLTLFTGGVRVDTSPWTPPAGTLEWGRTTAKGSPEDELPQLEASRLPLARLSGRRLWHDQIAKPLLRSSVPIPDWYVDWGARYSLPALSLEPTLLLKQAHSIMHWLKQWLLSEAHRSYLDHVLAVLTAQHSGGVASSPFVPVSGVAALLPSQRKELLKTLEQHAKEYIKTKEKLDATTTPDFKPTIITAPKVQIKEWQPPTTKKAPK